ncbi:hypothetical protein AAG906_012205 [Vitis piasezkii]
MSSNLPDWVFNYGNKEDEVKGTEEVLQHTANDVGNISNDEILVKERVSELPPTSSVHSKLLLQPPQGEHQGILRDERSIPQTKFGVDQGNKYSSPRTWVLSCR